MNPNTLIQTNYIHIDSAQRQNRPIHTYSELVSLPPYPLAFTSQSSIVLVHYPNHNLRAGDLITLNNAVSKSLMLSGVISVKKGSQYVRINHPNHGLSLYGLVDPSDSNQFVRVEYVGALPRYYTASDPISDAEPGYYVWRGNASIPLTIQLSGLRTDSGSIGNIPLNLLNGRQTAYLLFCKVGSTYQHDPNSWLLSIGITSSINYTDAQPTSKALVTGSNSIYLTYRNLFGIPLSYLNHGSNEHCYATVTNTSANTFEIDVGYPAIVDPSNPFYSSSDSNSTEQADYDLDSPANWDRGGGEQVYLRVITDTQPGYPTPSLYKYALDRTYHNITQVRLIASTFPNSQRLINTSNNKLRWRNLTTGDRVYELAITPGNYDTVSLEQAINAASKSRSHDLRVNIDTITDLVTIQAFKHKTIADTANLPALIIPDSMIEITFDLVFEPGIPVLAYFTALASPHTRHHLYTFQSYLSPLTMQLNLDAHTQVLINISEQSLLVSINTLTTLTDFEYDPQIRRLFKPNHNLNIGSVLITDTFEPGIRTYIVLEVMDAQSLILAPYTCCFIFDHYSWGLDTPIPAFNLDVPPHQRQQLLITHPNHKLQTGSVVTIRHSHAVNTVPASVINTTHTVSRIVDQNVYEVMLDPYAAVDVLDQPNTITVQYPDTIQLLFNHADTIGSYLGFEHAGTPIAITPFSHTHTNADPYMNEDLVRTPPKLNLTGHTYFYLCCPQLPSIHRTSPVPNVFAIIRWTDNPPSLVFDSFVPTSGLFATPLPVLSELDISTVNPDGTLVEFNQVDHTFTLEVTEAIQLPANTEVSARQQTSC